MARQGYPAEFRRRVIDFVEGGKKVAEVSRDLDGVSDLSLLQNLHWRLNAAPM